MKNFYEKMPSFTDYNELMNPKHYQSIPQDWFIVLTDIKGSTQAVQDGRYRDVNMVGSMAIASILNEIKQSLPFVFGGDGSTILIPPEAHSVVLTQMKNCIFLAQSKFKLNLRVAIIPMSKIYELNSRIDVAKYELSNKNYIAQFRGGGIDIAEKLTKIENSPYLINSTNEDYPNLEGLTCRWSPLKNDKGSILTLIIKPYSEEVIPKILESIKNISKSESFQQLSPVKMHNLTASWPPPMHLEAKATVKKESYLKTYLITLITNMLVYIFVKFNINTKDFSISKYKEETVSNSDYKKFDDTLRLVIDCSKEHTEEILGYLKTLENKNLISYGFCISEEAVMTCMVFSKENNDHIHFIDGAKGGYTLAAKVLKNKVKNLIGQKAS